MINDIVSHVRLDDKWGVGLVWQMAGEGFALQREQAPSPRREY
jgi:hypothetical protein